MTTLPLNEGSSVVLNASGNGVVTLGPTSTGETWNITKVSVIGTSAFSSEPICNVYVDSTAPENFFDGTQTGNQDSSDVTWTILQNGKLIAQFLGGQPGASHTLSVYGTRNLP